MDIDIASSLFDPAPDHVVSWVLPGRSSILKVSVCFVLTAGGSVGGGRGGHGGDMSIASPLAGVGRRAERRPFGGAEAECASPCLCGFRFLLCAHLSRRVGV